MTTAIGRGFLRLNKVPPRTNKSPLRTEKMSIFSLPAVRTGSKEWISYIYSSLFVQFVVLFLLEKVGPGTICVNKEQRAKSRGKMSYFAHCSLLIAH
jgi:hypothetical protein